MTVKDWAQLTFGLLNGLSFALTFRHSWRTKIIGSCALLIAHPGIAVYFWVTHQAFFLVNSCIMTSAGFYGLWRGLRMRRTERPNDPRHALVPSVTYGGRDRDRLA